jgi:hypothetical protein
MRRTSPASPKRRQDHTGALTRQRTEPLKAFSAETTDACVTRVTGRGIFRRQSSGSYLISMLFTLTVLAAARAAAVILGLLVSWSQTMFHWPAAAVSFHTLLAKRVDTTFAVNSGGIGTPCLSGKL